MKAIQIKNVNKVYKDVVALQNVSLTLEHGKIYGLLGRNGAGKSTLINIISNRVFADSGEALIDGLPAKENMDVQEKIFCMSAADDLYDKDSKAKDIYKWSNQFYDCFDIDKAFEIAKLFGLDTKRKFKNLSTGYQSIFKLSVALSLNVPYLILDEPVLGLDANHRELFYKILLDDYEKNERTIIIATHLIEEIANLIEDVILIEGGKLLLQESTESLLSKGYCVSGFKTDVDEYSQDKNVIRFEEHEALKVAYILGDKSQLPQNVNLQVTPMNLQKLFVKLTEKGGN